MINIIFDILAIVIIGISIISYIKLNNACKQGRKIESKDSISGCEVAQNILEKNELDNIYVVKTSNMLNERYDSTRKVIRLSEKVFDGTTITDILISSKECGSAKLDKSGNKMLRIRNMLLPTVDMITIASYIVMIISAFIRDFNFLRYSLLALIITILFHILFISVDKRSVILALDLLKEESLIDDSNIDEINKLANTLSYGYVGSTVTVVVAFIDYIKNKIS